MRCNDMNSDTPSLQIIVTALVVGGVSFIAGFILPLYFSTSNLGPLLGIFYTGPVGTLVGPLIGIVWSALHAGGRIIRAELWWLGSVLGLTLLYSMVFGAALLGIVAVPLMVLVIASGAFLLGNSKVCRSLPEAARRCGPMLLCAAVLILLTSMFPPVTSPWWGQEQARGRASVSEPLPKFAFVFDSRFDSNRHVPKFAVDRGDLAREWFVIAAVAGLVSIFIVARSKQPNVQRRV